MVNQPYSAKVYDEDVIRQNSAIFKCLTPTYVGDFLDIDSWFEDDFPIHKNDKYGKKYIDCAKDEGIIGPGLHQ